MDNQLLTASEAQDLLPPLDEGSALISIPATSVLTDNDPDLLSEATENILSPNILGDDLSISESLLIKTKDSEVEAASASPITPIQEQPAEISPTYLATINALRKSVSLIENELRRAKELLFSLGGSMPNLSLASKEAGPQGSIVEGVFNGEKMIASNGTIYNVPPNYASKSKLLEGYILKLTITLNGGLLFKQVRPIERKAVTAVLAEDEAGNFWAVAGVRHWRLLTASVTYYKGNTGDEVAILVPKNGDSRWAAVEYVRVRS